MNYEKFYFDNQDKWHVYAEMVLLPTKQMLKNWNMKSEIYNEDCLLGMSRYPDKYFELAIVDPPYGINIDKKWDSEPPKQEYFDELFRVSKNQIIWGGNYFNLPHSQGWICWDKTFRYNQKLDVSAFELAWTSLDIKATMLRFTYCGNFYGWKYPKAHYDKKPLIHIAQKPVEIYGWLLTNYAKAGDKILDTHGGSMSSVIACIDLGFDITCFELDKDYFESAKKRIKTHLNQSNLFTAKPEILFK